MLIEIIINLTRFLFNLHCNVWITAPSDEILGRELLNCERVSNFQKHQHSGLKNEYFTVH